METRRRDVISIGRLASRDRQQRQEQRRPEQVHQHRRAALRRVELLLVYVAASRRRCLNASMTSRLQLAEQ